MHQQNITLNYNPPVDFSNGKDWTALRSIHRELELGRNFVYATAKSLGIETMRQRINRGGKLSILVPTDQVKQLVDVLFQNSSKARQAKMLKTCQSSVEIKHRRAALKIVEAEKDSDDVEKRLERHCRALALICKELEAEISIDETGAEVHRKKWVTEKIPL